MMHSVAVVRQYLAATIFIVIGLMAYGCGDSATVSEPAELGNLSVSTGTLQPPFNPATTTYTVQLSSDVSSTTITASPRVAGDTIRIDNQPTTSQTITLDSPGAEKSVSIVVTDSGAGGGSKSYTVRVRRDLEDNSLQALSVSSGTLAPSPFDKDTLNYSVNGVGASVTSITISATKSDQDSIMQIGSVTVPAGTLSGQATIQLGGTGSATPVSIDITRPSGSKKTYTVTINRGPSDNSFLQSLSLPSGLQLNPRFGSSITAYTVNVANNVTSITVTPRAQDTTARITVNGQATNSGQPSQPIPLNEPGVNASRTNINITVIAQNNTTQKVYTVTVIRAALGGNNNLSALRVSPGSLDSAFNANDLSYTVNVGSNVTSITVTPTLEATTASMTVNGQATNSGQGRTITPLNPAGQTTTIPIVVTAQNGSQKTYTVNVVRAALGGNNNLQSLAVSQGTLDPAFSANTTAYTVDVGSSVTSISVTPTLSDPAATMTVNGQAATSGQGRAITLNGAGSNTVINVVVTAPNGSQKTYTVTVERAALGGNNNLQSLNVSPGTLNPSFRPDRVAYTVNVGSTVDSLTVTAIVQDAGATLTINGQGASSGQARAIPLGAAGSTTEIDVTVVAPNGNPRTYQIDVNRAALAGNNNLSALSVTPGTLSPSFAPATTTYTVDVASNVASVTMTATLQDTNATMTIEGQGTSSGQARSISLGAAGTSTEIDITVIAANGSQKTYTITVNRAAITAPQAPTSAPDLIPEDDSCPRDTVTNECLPGTSDADNITNINTPRFRIPQPGAGETPSLYVDGAKVDATFDQGANILRPTSALSDGNHSITSTVANAGGESTQSPSLTVTIDTVAPRGP